MPEKPPMKRFEGDFASLWKLDGLPPLSRLSWHWWWWLVMLPCPKHPERSRQLMILWSTKNTPLIDVNEKLWNGAGVRVGEGTQTLSGMVASWWYDGETMHEPLELQTTRMVAVENGSDIWTAAGDGVSQVSETDSEMSSEAGDGGGAIVPLMEADHSMGMAADRSHFWLRTAASAAAAAKGAATEFDLRIEPWNPALSTATHTHDIFAGSMGFDILRLHGAKVRGRVDGESVEGSAYFQKVTVQAPSIPWFWGLLHFDDGSYLDWFMPHASLSMTAKDDRPWKRRDRLRIPLRNSGLFHDARRGRTERFEACEVTLIYPDDEVDPERDDQIDLRGNRLPSFHIRLWNGRTQIAVIVRATSRARWTFDQPTRAGLHSHLTYNEYPLMVEELTILDEFEIRKAQDYGWIRGNAEHAWGLLH